MIEIRFFNCFFSFNFQFVSYERLVKENYSGGVFALTAEQYRKVNGHSNTFWAWGAEDDDLNNRMHNAGYFLDRYPHQVTAYKSMDHKPSFVNPNW